MSSGYVAYRWACAFAVPLLLASVVPTEGSPVHHIPRREHNHVIRSQALEQEEPRAALKMSVRRSANRVAFSRKH